MTFRPSSGHFQRQCVEEHKRSTLGNHMKDEHGKDPDTITSKASQASKS